MQRNGGDVLEPQHFNSLCPDTNNEIELPPIAITMFNQTMTLAWFSTTKVNEIVTLLSMVGLQSILSMVGLQVSTYSSIAQNLYNLWTGHRWDPSVNQKGVYLKTNVAMKEVCQAKKS